MKRCKVFPGFTNFYTYHYGAKSVVLNRTRHAQGGKVVHTHTMTFDTPEQARHFFDTECGA